MEISNVYHLSDMAGVERYICDVDGLQFVVSETDTYADPLIIKAIRATPFEEIGSYSDWLAKKTKSSRAEEIKNEIIILENRVTMRTLRGAALGKEEDIHIISGVEAQIAVLRSELAGLPNA